MQYTPAFAYKGSFCFLSLYQAAFVFITSAEGNPEKWWFILLWLSPLCSLTEWTSSWTNTETGHCLAKTSKCYTKKIALLFLLCWKNYFKNCYLLKYSPRMKLFFYTTSWSLRYRLSFFGDLDFSPVDAEGPVAIAPTQRCMGERSLDSFCKSEIVHKCTPQLPGYLGCKGVQLQPREPVFHIYCQLRKE